MFAHPVAAGNGNGDANTRRFRALGQLTCVELPHSAFSVER